MGIVYRYEHKECNFEFVFSDGYAMDSQLEYSSSELMRNGQWGEHWKKLMMKYPDGMAKIIRRICYCKQCNKYESRRQIKFYIPDDKFENKQNKFPFSVPKYKFVEEETMYCQECNTETTIIYDYSSIICPICGKLINAVSIGISD